MTQQFSLASVIKRIRETGQVLLFGRLIEDVQTIKLAEIKAVSIAGVCTRLPESEWFLAIVLDDGSDPSDRCGFKLPDKIWIFDPQSQLTILRPHVGTAKEVVGLADTPCTCVDRFRNGTDCSVEGTVHDHKVKVDIRCPPLFEVSTPFEIDVPDEIAEGTSVKVNLHLCGADSDKGARLEVWLNDQRVACKEILGDCDC
jgi:hypothetical protein